VDAFAIGTGRYPTEAEGLNVLVTQPAKLSGWNGTYLKQVKTDPWGHPYLYLGGPNGGPGYRVVSKGSDGLAGTSDDIDAGCDLAPSPSEPPTDDPAPCE
jgi:general secretion pathway protein G